MWWSIDGVVRVIGYWLAPGNLLDGENIRGGAGKNSSSLEFYVVKQKIDSFGGEVYGSMVYDVSIVTEQKQQK